MTASLDMVQIVRAFHDSPEVNNRNNVAEMAGVALAIAEMTKVCCWLTLPPLLSTGVTQGVRSGVLWKHSYWCPFSHLYVSTLPNRFDEYVTIV